MSDLKNAKPAPLTSNAGFRALDAEAKLRAAQDRISRLEETNAALILREEHAIRIGHDLERKLADALAQLKEGR